MKNSHPETTTCRRHTRVTVTITSHLPRRRRRIFWTMMILPVLLAFVLPRRMHAFQGPTPPSAPRRRVGRLDLRRQDLKRQSTDDQATTTTRTNTIMTTSRAEFWQHCWVTAMVAGTLTLTTMPPPVAYAATEATMEIDQQLAIKSALRTVKSAQRKLEAMKALYIESNDYIGLKQAIRVEPFSVIRKSCVTLLRAVATTATAAEKGGDNNNNNEPAEVERRYKQFIDSLEKMDSVASLAMRGRTLPENELFDAYQATVNALADFVNLAQPPMEQRPAEAFVE